MQHDAEKKMQIACTKCSLTLPFFATFLARMNVVQNDSIPTAATDGRKIYWNEAFIDTLDIDQCVGLLVHEILHIVCKHHLRIRGRDPKRWNIATDYVINPMVRQQKLSLPPNGLFDAKYIDWVAEKVYDDLPDEQDEQDEGGQFGDVMEPTNEDGSAMSPGELEAEAIDVDQTITVASKAQKDIGSLPGAVQLMITQAGEPQIPWQDVLQKFVGGDNPDGENRDRPARHQWWYARMMQPSLRKTNLGHLVIAIDTSASMSDAELRSGFSECKAITEDHNPERVTVIYCDTEIQKVEVFEQGEIIDRLNIKGRGGTRVRPPIDWARNAMDRVDRFIYITDMEFSDAGQEPEFPLLWLGTHKKSPSIPYGEYAHIPPGGGQ